MKRITIITALLLALAGVVRADEPMRLAHMNVAIVGGGVPTAESGEPAAGTIIAGANTTYSSDTISQAANRQYYNNATQTATWSASDSTTTVSSVFLYMTANNTGNCKAFITTSSGTIISNGISNVKGFTEDDTPLWREFTYTSKPTLTKTTAYRIGYVCNSDYTVITPTATGGQGPMFNDGNSYTTPGSVVPGSDSNYGQGAFGAYAIH
jgi:hypothetical protein